MSTFEKWKDKARYETQTRLIRAALDSEGHELDVLLAGMEASNQEGAIYFSGGRLDSDFCFGSGDLALIISKLPKDATKAGMPGYHPASTEVYIVFKGSLTMDFLEEKRLASRYCRQFEVVVIPPGQCHRIQEDSGKDTASLIAKTNPRQEPSVVRCKDCTYFAPPADCPVRAKWLRERRLALQRSLADLHREMEDDIAELEANCPSKMYRDFSDGSSSYSEILHAGATLSQIRVVRERYRARAADVVRTWLHDDGLPDMQQMAQEAWGEAA